MIAFKTENFTRVQPEYAAFVHRYWDNSLENKDEEPLDFDWDVFLKMDADRLLHLTVGRDEGMMVAAALYMIMMDPKHRKRRLASCDTFAVARAYRNSGIGKQLYTAAEKALRTLGVNEIRNGYREVYHTKPLFEKLGFRLIERTYSKKVD